MTAVEFLADPREQGGRRRVASAADVIELLKSGPTHAAPRADGSAVGAGLLHHGLSTLLLKSSAGVRMYDSSEAAVSSRLPSLLFWATSKRVIDPTCCSRS